MPVNRRSPLNRGCAAWWLTVPHLFGGRLWYELIGQNHGTLTNMTTAGSGWGGSFRRGSLGGEMRFDASNDYLALPVSTLLEVATVPFSVSAWVNLASGATGQNSIFSKHRDVAITGGQFVLHGSRSPNPELVLLVEGGVKARATATTDIRGAGWTHLVGVYDRSRAYIYINAIEEHSKAASGDLGTDYGTKIGQSGWGDHFFDGPLDDVRFYRNRALSPAEVAALYWDSMLGYPESLNWVELGPFGSSRRRRRPAFSGGLNMHFVGGISA